MKEYVTKDLAFASYLLYKGHQIDKLIRKNGRVKWQFKLTQEDLDKCHASFPTSESFDFISKYNALKRQLG